MDKSQRHRRRFALDAIKPIEHGFGVFPLMLLESVNNLGINAAKNSFADLADLCFSWIDEAACWFVIFEGYECFALGSGVHPVAELQFI